MLKYPTCTSVPVSSPLVSSVPLCWAQNQAPSESPCPNMTIPRFFPPVMLKYHVTVWDDRAYRTDTQRINDSVRQMRKIHDGVHRAKKKKTRLHTRDIRSGLALSTHNYKLINCPARDNSTRCHLRFESTNLSSLQIDGVKKQNRIDKNDVWLIKRKKIKRWPIPGLVPSLVRCKATVK